MDKISPNHPISKQEDMLECAICLQPCQQPVEFPCSHVFCFLCAKGTAMQSLKCALCRSPIPKDFLKKPSLFTKQSIDEPDKPLSELRYVWFYQGYNGWWQYDDRTCTEIETAYANSAKCVDVLVAGSVYTIDIENKIQYQRNRNSRKRNIKRDVVTAHKKGVAGIEITATHNTTVPEPSSSASSQTPPSGNSPQNIVCTSALPNNLTAVQSRDCTRQGPLGSDDLLSRSSQIPPLLRSSTEPLSSSAFSSSQTLPTLTRFNTHLPSSTEDQPME